MVFLESLQLNSLELNAYRAGFDCKMTSMVPRGKGNALSEEVRQVRRQTPLAHPLPSVSFLTRLGPSRALGWVRS